MFYPFCVSLFIGALPSPLQNQMKTFSAPDGNKATLPNVFLRLVEIVAGITVPLAKCLIMVSALMQFMPFDCLAILNVLVCSRQFMS